MLLNSWMKYASVQAKSRTTDVLLLAFWSDRK
jgi:hypothetical protein